MFELLHILTVCYGHIYLMIREAVEYLIDKYNLLIYNTVLYTK
jgi:hypothetical protein